MLPARIRRRIPRSPVETPPFDVVKAVAALDGYVVRETGTGTYWLDHELVDDASMEEWSLSEVWRIVSLPKGNVFRPADRENRS